MKLPRKKNAGFTLVEVTLALGVASFCLVSVFGLLTVGVKTNAVAIEQTTATNVLSAVAADLRSVPNPLPKANQVSTVYQIAVPVSLPTPSGSAPTPVPTTTHSTSYVDETSQPVVTNLQSGTSSEAAAASPTPVLPHYLLNVWTTPGIGREPTLVRLVLSWPSQVALENAAGSVETVISLDRN